MFLLSVYFSKKTFILLTRIYIFIVTFLIFTWKWPKFGRNVVFTVHSFFCPYVRKRHLIVKQKLYKSFWKKYGIHLHCPLFIMCNSQLNHHKNSFSIVWAKIWNSIPESYRSLPKHIFKKKIQALLFATLGSLDSYADTSTLISEIKKAS